MQNKLFLVGNLDTTYPKKEYSKNLLNELPLIFREKGSGTRRMMEKFIETNSISVKKRMELTSNEAVKQSIKAGLGYSIMPLIGIRNELQYGQLQIVPVKGLPIVSNWSLVWMKGKNLSPVAKAFLQYVEENKEEIIKAKFGWYENY
jgi:DNA-binding transcriptional LysR family regulator